MKLNLNYIVIVLAGILLAMTFILGRCSKSCPEVVAPDEVERVSIKVDTVWKNQTIVWKNPKVMPPTIAYIPSTKDTVGNIQSSGGIFQPNMLRWIRDSIRTGGVGLTFEHLTSGDIYESRYDVKYPEIKTDRISSTTRTIFRKNAWGIGVTAITGLQGDWKRQIELAPMISYRYDKLQVGVGYGLMNQSIMINVTHEF